MPVSALRHARLDADFTLFDMQQLAGVLQSRLSLIERGLVIARSDEQARLAQALHLEVERLFPAPGRVGHQGAGSAEEVGELVRRAELKRHLRDAEDALRAARAIAD